MISGVRRRATHCFRVFELALERSSYVFSCDGFSVIFHRFRVSKSCTDANREFRIKLPTPFALHSGSAHLGPSKVELSLSPVFRVEPQNRFYARGPRTLTRLSALVGKAVFYEEEDGRGRARG